MALTTHRAGRTSTRFNARRIVGHGDIAPWNAVSRDGRAGLEHDCAGPVGTLHELAHAC